jgi:hypothetical protein
MGVSIHQMARYYVTRCLSEGEERDALGRHLRELVQECTEVRTDLANAVVVLLSSAGKVADDDAQTWVNENLNQSCSPSPYP